MAIPIPSLAGRTRNNVVSRCDNGIRRSYIHRVRRRRCSRRWRRNDSSRRCLVLPKTRAHTQYEAQSNYGHALHSRHRSPPGTPFCVRVGREVFHRRCLVRRDAIVYSWNFFLILKTAPYYTSLACSRYCEAIFIQSTSNRLLSPVSRAGSMGRPCTMRNSDANI